MEYLYAGANNMDYPDVIIADLRHALERAEREHRSLEWIITTAGYDWSAYTLYEELSAVDLDSLTPQERASHVVTVYHVTIELLDTYDLLVALDGDRLAPSRSVPQAQTQPQSRRLQSPRRRPRPRCRRAFRRMISRPLPANAG